MQLRRTHLADLAAVLATCALPLLAAYIGARGPSVVEFRLGPNDASYLTGFAPLYEIADGDATRWSTHHARIDLPLSVRGGPAELSLRFSRVLAQTAQVSIRLGGHIVDHFECRGGGFEVRTVSLPALTSTPLTLEIEVDSHDRRNLGLKLDWVRLEVSEGTWLHLRGLAPWRSLAFALLLFVLLRVVGFSPAWAYGLSVPWLLIQAAWVMNDPLGLAHVSSHIALPSLAFAGMGFLMIRRRPGARWVVPIFLAGYLLKGAGLFSIGYYYPDVMNHRRYVLAFAETEGSLVERGVAAQVEVKTGYPRFVAGKAYAFPYSPVFFVPFAWLAPDAGLIEDALRHVSLLAGAAEVIVVFWLAGLVFGPSSGLAAALLAAALPVMYSRLLLGMWPTIAGHLLDTLVFGAALLLVSRKAPARWHLAGLALCTWSSMLTYIASLFNLGAFLGVWAALERRSARRLLAVLASCVALTVLLLYRDFTVAFLSEILPALLRGGAGEGGEEAAGGVAQTLGRIPIFYGYGYPTLALAGLALAYRRVTGPVFRVLLAWGLAFAGLVALRAFGAGLFKDLKEMIFVAPLVALLAGYVLESLAARGRAGRLAAALIALGLVAFGLGKYQHDFRSHGQVAQQSLEAPRVVAESARLGRNLRWPPTRIPSPSS